MELNHCSRCSSEFCDIHGLQPCDCDTIDRHAIWPCDMIDSEPETVETCWGTFVIGGEE